MPITELALRKSDDTWEILSITQLGQLNSVQTE